MNTPLINVDILHNVIPYTNFSTILQLTKTCHEFNAECAQYLLIGEVDLEGEDLVESFISFLTASGRCDYARRRFPFLTNVELSVGPSPSERIKSALTELFVLIGLEATRFTYLALHDSNVLLAPDSPLAKAVAALTTLEELVIYEYGSHCAAMLWTLQSRLVTVKLVRDASTIGQSPNDPLPYPVNDPLYLLHRSQGTLERMEVDLPVMLRQGFCYPSLVELEIFCPDHLPITWTYIRAFPNLEELTVEFDDDIFSQERAPTALACSQWNIAEQHRLGTWNTLSHVEGTIQDLFLLGLTCAIAELTITIHGVDFEDLRLLRCEADAWRQILAYARPETVTLHVHDSDWIVDDHGFSLLSETPQLVSLHSLNVFVHVSYDMGAHPEGMGRIDALDLLWDIVVVWIKPVDLSVTFDWTGWGALAARMSECAGDDALEPAFPREKLEAVDIEAHARRFVHEHTRSVRYSLVGPDGWRRDTRCFGPGVSPEEQAAVIEEQMEVD